MMKVQEAEERVIQPKRSSADRVKQIATEFGLGRAVVENILKRDLELRKEELVTYGVTTLVGLFTVKAIMGSDPTDVTIRGRASQTLEAYVAEERLRRLERG